MSRKPSDTETALGAVEAAAAELESVTREIQDLEAKAESVKVRIGNEVRRARDSVFLDRRKLAREAGISPSHMANIEAGAAASILVVIPKLCRLIRDNA